jgi:hypothetical protein
VKIQGRTEDLKAARKGSVAGSFERIGTSAEIWQARMKTLREGRLLGRCFPASRQRLKVVAERVALRRVANLDKAGQVCFW